MKYRLQIDIDVDLNGTNPEVLLNNLRYIARNANSNGLFTCNTDAELRHYSATTFLPEQIRDPLSYADPKTGSRLLDTVIGLALEEGINSVQIGESSDGSVAVVDTSNGDVWVLELRNMDAPAKKKKKRQADEWQKAFNEWGESMRKFLAEPRGEYTCIPSTERDKLIDGLDAKLGVLGKVIDELVAKAHAPLMTRNDQGVGDALIAQMAAFDGSGGRPLESTFEGVGEIGPVDEAVRLMREAGILGNTAGNRRFGKTQMSAAVEAAKARAQEDIEIQKSMADTSKAGRSAGQCGNFSAAYGADAQTARVIGVPAASQLFKDAGLAYSRKPAPRAASPSPVAPTDTLEGDLSERARKIVAVAEARNHGHERVAALAGGIPQMGVSNVRAAAAADAVAPVAETVSITRVVTPIFTEGQVNVTWAVEPFCLLLQAGNHALKTPITPGLLQALNDVEPQ